MTTYPLTATALTEHVRKLLLTNTAVKDHWTDADILVLLNEAQNDVFLELLNTFREEYFVEIDDNVVTTTGEIDLRSLKRPYYRLLNMERVPDNGLVDSVVIVPVGRVREYLRRAPDKEIWYVVGHKLKTDRAVSSNVYSLTYHYKIPDLNGGNDITEIPSEYQEMIAYRAAYICAMQVGDRDRMSSLKGEYDERVERMRHTAKLKTLMQRRTIADVEGYDLDDMSGMRYIYPTS